MGEEQPGKQGKERSANKGNNEQLLTRERATSQPDTKGKSAGKNSLANEGRNDQLLKDRAIAHRRKEQPSNQPTRGKNGLPTPVGAREGTDD
ncbi:hypothetical protein V496_03316 [Pseudogymnoascus sp. VKM F-4515 (FW-2607)]|nr:hypothetical protein V496_03316 [Pseudogymnoascus sp. VKM F-4515 (FW-2607)]KFY78250.1 hypothetical protein V498_09167 [Pseudogymnoascus sp. VKM F-4517 (FW-2822)]